jgi:hypothetical protein
LSLSTWAMLLIRFAGIGWCRLSEIRCDRDDVDIDRRRGGDQQAIGAGRQLYRGIAVGGDRGQHGDVGRIVRSDPMLWNFDVRFAPDSGR